MSLLSRHSIAVKPALVLMRMSILFSFVVFSATSYGILSCSAWECHNSKSVSSPSHQINQGKKINFPCITCGHILLSSSSVLSLSQELLSRAALCAICPSPGLLSSHMCSQLSHKVWKCLCGNNCVFFVCSLKITLPLKETITSSTARFSEKLYNLENVLFRSKFFSPTNAPFIKHMKC